MTKKQAPSNKQIKRNKSQTSNKVFDLEKRTLDFSRNVIRLCRLLPKEAINFKLIDQLIRAATSIGANYREANDALSKKDFIHRLKISRREAKETVYWLELVLEANPGFNKEIFILLKESKELRNILSAIINKST